MKYSINELADDDPAKKDHQFNPYRRARTEKSREIVKEALKLFQNYEAVKGLRKRKRRAVDQHTFAVTIEALLCDLMFLHVSGYTCGIYLSRSKKVLGAKSRYRPAIFGDKLPATLDVLRSPELAYVDQTIGHRNQHSQARQTTLVAGKRLLKRIEELHISVEDFSLSQQQEVIILRRTKKDRWDQGGKLEYLDTDQTKRIRNDLQSINDWLADAHIEFDPVALEGKPPAIDLGERSLRRIFTQGRFDRGGRLFGGFFQTLKKQHRIDGLLIEGEEVVELDYGQMNPRIIYGINNAQPTQEDLYAIPGYEGQRNGIKKVMNAMMFSTKPLMRMPEGVRKHFSDRHSIGDVCEAIVQTHPLLEQIFYTGIGHEAQFIESEIMMDVLLTLKTKEIVALPIHDAIIVGQSHLEEAREIMLFCFHHHTGLEGKVTIEGGRQFLSTLQGSYELAA